MTTAAASLNRVFSQPRWTVQNARDVLDALAASGLSAAEFAARHAIQVQRLYLWRRRLRESAPFIARSTTAFVEVGEQLERTTEIRASSAARYELVLSQGDTLRIEGTIDVRSVGALLALLRGGRTC